MWGVTVHMLAVEWMFAYAEGKWSRFVTSANTVLYFMFVVCASFERDSYR